MNGTATASAPVNQLDYTTIDKCRVCGTSGEGLVSLYSFGDQYVSNFVYPLDLSRRHPKCPLELVLCKGCSLVQLRHTARQDFMYTRHYWYRSGVTETMRLALRDITRQIELKVDLKPGDVVLDIGSNDGTLLRSYTVPGLTKVGVEPATNLKEEGKRGVDHFINDFWSYDAYDQMWEDYCDVKCIGVVGPKDQPYRKAKVVTAIGMFYDLPDPNQFIADIAKVLADDGLFVAQLMCLKNMLNMNDLGNVCHEHLEFYSFRSLRYLFAKNGLQIMDVETNRVNGESYRIYARKRLGKTSIGGMGGSGGKVERLGKKREPIPAGGAGYRIINTSRNERGLDDPEYYKPFIERWEKNREEVRSFIIDAAAAGKKVWVYGASTKGNFLLQWYGLDDSLIRAAADRSPEKWGLYTVGTNIPIKSEAEFRMVKPDYALVLPYAFLPEFLEREREWRAGGGKFIVPLPEFQVI